MTPHDRKIIGITLGAIVALAAVAGIAAYATHSMDTPTMTAQQPSAQQMAGMAPAAGRPHCNDHNIVGTVAGGVLGGVVGNQFGHGSGKTLTTVGGAAGGAYLGNAYIPTRGATCN